MRKPSDPKEGELMPPAVPAGSAHPAVRPTDGHVVTWPAAAAANDVEPQACGIAAAGIEIFTELDAMGFEGWQSLRALVVVCRRVILWAPSLALLESLRSYGPALPSPQEVVAWVRDGRVQILAPESWLSGEFRDTSLRIGPKARAAYDQLTEILRFDVRDRRTGISARVRTAPEAKDLPWAFNEFWSSEIDLSRLHHESLARLPGYLDNAARLGDPRLASVALLRTIHNRGQAFVFSGANRTLDSPNQATASAIALECTKLRRAGPAARTVTPPVDSEAIAAAIRTAVGEGRARAGASGTRNAGKGWFAARPPLGSQEAVALRTWIAGCDAWVERGSGRPLSTFADSLLGALFADQPSVPAELALMTAVQKVALVGSVAIGLASNVGAGSPLSMSHIPVAGAAEINHRVAQPPYSSAGERWPYYVVQPPDDAHRVLRETLIRKLIEL